MIEVRRYRDDYIAGDEGWRRVTGNEGVLGVWALRYNRDRPWIWEVALGVATGAPHLAPPPADVEGTLLAVPGVAGVRSGGHGDRWRVRGAPSGERLVRAVAELVDASIAAGRSQPDPTKAAQKLIVQGLRSRGFRGRPPKLRRARPTGSIEFAVVGEDWRRGTVWIDLSFVPAALLRVWEEVDHWMLERYDRGAAAVGLNVRVGHLDRIPDGEHTVDRTAPEATVEAVLGRFDELGQSWFDLFREDGTETTSLAARNEATLGGSWEAPTVDIESLAAYLLCGPRDPSRAADMIRDLTAKAGRLRKPAYGPFEEAIGQDAAVLERLAGLLSEPPQDKRQAGEA